MTDFCRDRDARQDPAAAWKASWGGRFSRLLWRG